MYGLFTAWSQMAIGFIATKILMQFDPELNPFFAQTMPSTCSGLTMPPCVCACCTGGPPSALHFIR